MKWATPLCLCMFFLVACGGGGSSSGSGAAQSSLDGSWVGPWESSEPAFPGSGLARFNIQQSGGEVAGTGTLTGSPCIDDTGFDGLVSGNAVSINLVGTLATVSVDFQRVGENTLEGDWRVTASSVCGGSGTVTLNRE